MNRLFHIILLLMVVISVSAQGQRKFDPDKYRRDQEAFIIKKAKLTPQEATKFFPLFREMQDKKRALMNSKRQSVKQKPTTDKEAQRIMESMDAVDLQVVKLETQYHKRFCQAISAQKVMSCIRADEQFNRQLMERMTGQRHGDKNPRQGDKTKSSK